MDQATLKSKLNYDPDTGLFSCAETGARRGSNHNDGYTMLHVGSERILAHRAAWLWVNGELPGGFIDHINGDRTDNRICNLRDVPRSVNCQNLRRPHRKKKHQVMGIYKTKAGDKWLAKIGHQGRTIKIGFFACPLVAHLEYLKAKRVLHAGCTI